MVNTDTDKMLLSLIHLLITLEIINMVDCSRYPEFSDDVMMMSDHSDGVMMSDQRDGVMMMRDNDTESRERERRSFYRSGASLGQETSKTLDYLLFESGYNRRVRPDSGGGPVEVNVNLAIRYLYNI